MSSSPPKRTWEQFRAQWKAIDRSGGGPRPIAVDTWHAASDHSRDDDYIADEGEEHRFECSNPRCLCPLWIGKELACPCRQGVYYCSKECQKRDWPQHKKQCTAAKQKPVAQATGAHDWEGELMQFSDGPMVKFKCTLCDRTCVDMGDGSNIEFQKQLSLNDCRGRK
jgi:hypothetical protein